MIYSEKLLDLSIWNANDETIDVFVKSGSIDGVQQLLAEANIRYEVIVEDYQMVIDEENPTQVEIALMQRKSGT